MEKLDLKDGFYMQGHDYKIHSEYYIELAGGICIKVKSSYTTTTKEGYKQTKFIMCE